MHSLIYVAGRGVQLLWESSSRVGDLLLSRLQLLHLPPANRVNMPAGFTRLNERTQLPNENIVFFKPLEGPDKEIAEDFLKRIAAICAPICKRNHLIVTSLEEFPPNREFWGRNFNAGECIQLVLKSQNGRWLPFRFVQMVMMHELAHCQQMNHSRAFWKVRNGFAAELEELWSKGYTGDGFWGRGQTMYNGQYTEDTMPSQGESPEHLCGGVYRGGRRGGKRGRKGGTDTSQLTYAEKKQRRIEKKFGKGGLVLGADDETKVKLENGKKTKGKPRVAGSVRGRELRAAAALARFEKSSKASSSDIKDDDSETEDDDDYDEPAIKIEAVDHDRHKILDKKGNSLVRVCENEDLEHDEGAQQEMDELRSFSRLGLGSNSDARRKAQSHSQSSSKAAVKQKQMTPATIASEDDELTASEGEGTANKQASNAIHDDDENLSSGREKNQPQPAVNEPTEPLRRPLVKDPTPRSEHGGVCTICSLENGSDALTCAACGHVLDTTKLPNHWKCKSATCSTLGYINVDDNGLCGLCGTSKG